MTANLASSPARIASGPDLIEGSRIDTWSPASRLIALAATLVLVATTGLSMRSVANLIPQADDPTGPFLGI